MPGTDEPTAARRRPVATARGDDGGSSSRPRKPKKLKQPAKPASSGKPAKPAKSSGEVADQPVTALLARPDTTGPKVRLGVLWFLVAVGSLVVGRWGVLVVWGGLSGLAAWQVTSAWAETPRAAGLPSWAPAASAATAVLCTAASGVGTGLGGVALIVAPIALIAVVSVTGQKPAVAGSAVIGAVLAAVPTMSVVLVARHEQWAALFLVVAVSFYDAGYFIGAADSSSRLEGPVTGAIGLLAVTFAASAFEAAPFDRTSAWMAGVVMMLACPLGQMLVSAELPQPRVSVSAMRRLDAYLVSGPLMLAAVWALG